MSMSQPKNAESRYTFCYKQQYSIQNKTKKIPLTISCRDCNFSAKRYTADFN